MGPSDLEQLEQPDDMRHPSNLPWKGRNADPEIVLPILRVIGLRLPAEPPFSAWMLQIVGRQREGGGWMGGVRTDDLT
jgi:hypothetical protein